MVMGSSLSRTQFVTIDKSHMFAFHFYYMPDGILVPGRIDPDPESSIGKKIPPWISILIDKYVASLSVASSARSVVTIGKLSVFLTGCVRGEVACSQPETDALIVVCFRVFNPHWSCCANHLFVSS